MKDIMGEEGTNLDKAVPSLEYNPATHDQIPYLSPCST